jgi:hypothetical protein
MFAPIYWLMAILAADSLWNIIAGFIGAINGAAIAYLFQNRREILKRKESEKAQICKYSLIIDRIYSYATGLQTTALNRFQADPIRHINIPPIHTINPRISEQEPTLDLYFLVESLDVEVIAKILNIQDRYIGLSEMVEKRNDLHINKLQPIAQAHNISQRMVSKEELMEWLGQPLYQRLESATNAIYLDAEYIIRHYTDTKTMIRRVFKNRYPKGKMIDIIDLGHEETGKRR